MSGIGRQATFVAPATRAEGRVVLPGDKSISHRLLILASVAEGESCLENVATGADVAASARALEALGVGIVEVRSGETSLRVTGSGWRSFREGGGVARAIDCGNSGTTARLLMGLLAGREGRFTLDGDASLRERPMGRVADPLRRLGARIEGRETLPLEVRGGSLVGSEVHVGAPSAQVKGAVLLAALQARGASRIVEPVPTRDHTERLAAFLGAPVRRRACGSIDVDGGCSPLVPWNGRVPGDPSSGFFFSALAAAIPGSRVELGDVSVNETRLGGYEVLRRMGARIEVTRDTASGPEPSGTVVVRGGRLRGVDLDPAESRECIDEVPMLAILAARAEGTSVLRGLSELRVKESDRLEGARRLVQQVGGRASVEEDALVVAGEGKIRGGEVDPGGDHRLAMAAAVAGAISGEGVAVADAGCVAVSFPEFFRELRGLVSEGS